MLNSLQQRDGVLAIKKTITGIRNKPYEVVAIKECLVTAAVNDEVIVDSEIIECQFQMEKNYSIINIYWEDYGYKHYKKLGLFGQMRTDYQYVESIGPSQICIKDQQETYEITIKF